MQRGIPASHLIKYFNQTGGLWQIDAALRKIIKFNPFNLLDDYSLLRLFDIVFCRNVLIYFDWEAKRNILKRICKQMHTGSFLVLGASESIVGITDAFIPFKGTKGLDQVNPKFSGRLKEVKFAIASAQKFPDIGLVHLKSA